MAIGSGLSGQLGIKAEGVYGTPEVVDRFYEFNSEGIESDVRKIRSRGIGTGRFQRNDRGKTYVAGAAGSIEMDVLNKSFGLWFQHMLGQDTVTSRTASGTANVAVTCTATKLIDTRLALVVNAWKGATVTCDAKTLLVTSNDATSFTGAGWVASQPADNLAWSVASLDKIHTCIHDAAALAGKSLTLQVGRPDVAGTVDPFTCEGGKILDWELKAAIDEKLTLGLGMDFENVLTGTALAAASYPSLQEMFVFTEGALTIGGAAQAVRSIGLKGSNALDTDRRFLGGTKKEPLANGEWPIEGTLDCEFESLDRYTAWLAGTQAQLILSFTLATLIPTTSIPYSVTVTIPKIEYVGETPKVGGPEIVRQGAPFKALFDGTNPILSLVYVTSDAAA